eukprot:12488045-Alexandrium_andersonii.AAC.1
MTQVATHLQEGEHARLHRMHETSPQACTHAAAQVSTSRSTQPAPCNNQIRNPQQPALSKRPKGGGGR